MRLLESVTGPYAERDYCILTFFLNCGMRVSELVGLNLTDFKDDTVRVLGKGGKQRTVFLNDACLAALEQYLPKRLEPNEQDTDALFVSKKRNRINVQTVKWLVKKYIGQAGLDPKKILCAQAASHSGNAHVPERRGYPHTAKHSWSLECGYDHDLHPHRE